MNPSLLGKKIKEARLAKKMTQKEVVGNFITRNMLSQIESGNAMPSLKTLKYLSQVLDLPDLILKEETLPAYTQLQDAKELLRKKNYQELIEKYSAYPQEFRDEFPAMLALACLGFAKQLITAGQLPDAASLLKNAIFFSSKGLYANSSLKTESILLLQEIAEKLGSYYLQLSASHPFFVEYKNSHKNKEENES